MTKTLNRVLIERLRQPEGFWLRISLDPRLRRWASYNLHEVGTDHLVVSRRRCDGTFGEKTFVPLRVVKGLRICE